MGYEDGNLLNPVILQVEVRKFDIERYCGYWLYGDEDSVTSYRQRLKYLSLKSTIVTELLGLLQAEALWNKQRYPFPFPSFP